MNHDVWHNGNSPMAASVVANPSTNSDRVNSSMKVPRSKSRISKRYRHVSPQVQQVWLPTHNHPAAASKYFSVTIDTIPPSRGTPWYISRSCRCILALAYGHVSPERESRSRRFIHRSTVPLSKEIAYNGSKISKTSTIFGFCAPLQSDFAALALSVPCLVTSSLVALSDPHDCTFGSP